MDTLPERLRALTEKKYFAVIAVIFFAFVTALIFAFLAQQNTAQNVDQLRTDIKSGNFERGDSNIPGGASELPAESEEKTSLLDRIISGVTGRKTTSQRQVVNKDAENVNQPIQGGGAGRNINSGTTIPSNNQRELNEKVEREAMPLPKVVVKDYVLNTTLPAKPEAITIYRQKTTYSESDIEKMAIVLGFAPLNGKDVVIEKNNGGLVQIFDLKNKLFLAINNKTGTVLFTAKNGLPTSGDGDSKQKALALARSLGYNQSCLKATASYTKKSAPHTTHTDIHCDWNSTGAPIVNYFGILNLPVNEALKDVQLGALPAPSDGDIQDDDTGTMSLRPNDFNTITVQQDTLTGNIMAFSSNILPVIAEIEIPAGQIVSPDEGFEKLKNNVKQFAFATPQGTGFTDLRNVYINNTASAESVQVGDFVLAYPVVPGVPQEYLCPAWLTRSQGRLESGHDGLFVESTAAVADSRCGKTAVLGATIAQAVLPNPNPTVIAPESRGDTLQYKNFTVEGEPQSESSCPQKDQFTNALRISDGVYIAWIDRNTRSAGNRRLGTPGQLTGPLIQREWYIVVTSQQQVTNALGSGEDMTASQRSEYLEFRRERAVKCQIGSRDVCPLPSGLAGSAVACKFLTTGSPSLYIQSTTPQKIRVTIKPIGGLAFTNPAPTYTNTWQIDSTSFERIYWEYNKKALSEALSKAAYDEKGYIVKKTELLSLFSQKLPVELNLNEKQTYDLLGEVKREFNSLQSDYVKVVLLPRDILDTYLPVSISPAPKNFYRYFFVISNAGANDTLKAPEIAPVIRSDYTAVETGTLFDIR